MLSRIQSSTEQAVLNSCSDFRSESELLTIFQKVKKRTRFCFTELESGFGTRLNQKSLWKASLLDYGTVHS